MPIPNLSNSTPGPELPGLNNTSNETTTSHEGSSLFGEDGFTFGDILDIVNPLQHIPVVGTIYRKITGDTIAPAMQIAGGALFGGPLGAAMSMVTTAIQTQFNKNDGADPDSPYRENGSTTINPATIANNSPQHFPKTTSSNDYSITTDSSIRQSVNDYQLLEKADGWVLSSRNINKEITFQNTKELYANNIIQRKTVYPSGDGIVNPAHKNTEIYTNVVTSTNSTAKGIDIIIGSAFDAG